MEVEIHSLHSSDMMVVQNEKQDRKQSKANEVVIDTLSRTRTFYADLGRTGRGIEGSVPKPLFNSLPQINESQWAPPVYPRPKANLDLLGDG
jgi:hypothetical protein